MSRSSFIVSSVSPGVEGFIDRECVAVDGAVIVFVGCAVSSVVRVVCGVLFVGTGIKPSHLGPCRAYQPSLGGSTQAGGRALCRERR